MRFEEKQRPGWIIGPILVLCVGLPLWGVVQQVGYGKPWGNHPVPNGGLIAISALLVLFGAWMGRLTLITRVDGQKLSVRLSVFGSDDFPLADIRLVRVGEYRARQYLGWGHRQGPDDTCYTMRGKRGVFFELANGQRWLIGSQRPEELAAALTRS